MVQIWVVMGLVGLGLQMAWAEPNQVSTINLNLSELEKQAFEYSERLKSARSETAAAEFRVQAQSALLYPRLSLDASYRYVKEVPTLTLPVPGAPHLAFGDHETYSVGPMITWTAFDGGAFWDAWKSSKALKEAKEQDLEVTRRQVNLQVRLAYLRVVLGVEQIRMVGDSLSLAQAQDRDIKNRLSAGASSRIDALSAHREVLNLRNQFRTTQSELSSALRDLLTLTQGGSDADLSAPLEAGLAHKKLEDIGMASVWVQSESLDKMMTQLQGADHGPGDQHPQIRALDHQIDATRLAAQSVKGGLYPRVQVMAKASYDYPNGPILERIQQTTVGATLSWPLFEFSKTRAEASEKGAQANALEQKKALAISELNRDFQKVRDQLKANLIQRTILLQSAQEASELAKLVYAAYQAGRSSFLEVQSSNLKALEAKVQLARNDVQILIQKAQLENLSGEKL